MRAVSNLTDQLSQLATSLPSQVDNTNVLASLSREVGILSTAVESQANAIAGFQAKSEPAPECPMVEEFDPKSNLLDNTSMPKAVTTSLNKCFAAFKKSTELLTSWEASAAKHNAELEALNAGRVPNGMKPLKLGTGPKCFDQKLESEIVVEIKLDTSLTHREAKAKIHMETLKLNTKVDIAVQELLASACIQAEVARARVREDEEDEDVR